MKIANTTQATLAAMLLLGLAMAGPAAAGQSGEEPYEDATFEGTMLEDGMPEDTVLDDGMSEDGMLEDGMSETDGEAFVSGEDDFNDMAGADSEPSADAAADEEQSEGKRLKKGLKRILVGALLIAAERKTHDALGIGTDAEDSQESDPEPR